MGAEEEMSAGIIVLILILALFVLLPLAAFFYARNKYGPGKEIDFMRHTCSHSNAAVPFLYMPKEMREDKLSALNSKPNLMNNQQEEKKMRLYFEGEKIWAGRCESGRCFKGRCESGRCALSPI